jgi:hypothetical protein
VFLEEFFHWKVEIRIQITESVVSHLSRHNEFGGAKTASMENLRMSAGNQTVHLSMNEQSWRGYCLDILSVYESVFN